MKAPVVGSGHRYRQSAGLHCMAQCGAAVPLSVATGSQRVRVGCLDVCFMCTQTRVHVFVCIYIYIYTYIYIYNIHIYEI